ncbi:MAG TPA: hypothetical protein VMK66_13150, partial [Myxococcales bacterium]|nr:hypothetical protein [Myxococcales bacterium]
MRWWGGLVGVLAFACQQAAPLDASHDHDPDGGPSGQVTPLDGGPTDAGPDDGSGGGYSHPGWPPPRPGYLNPIPAENQRPGDANWNRGFSRPWAAQVEAYADRVSARAGDTVRLMVRSDTPGASASWTLYRLGWY